MPRCGTTLAAAATCLLAVAGCGSPYADLPPEQRAVAERGRQLYDQFTCGRCHGEDRSGQRTAPPLTGMAAHWDEPTLIRYLRDPESERGRHARLLQLRDTYTLTMPATPGSDQELHELAAYLFLDPPER